MIGKISTVSKKRLNEELLRYEAKTEEYEGLIRSLGKALDVIPVTAISKGQTWMPSDDALLVIKRAKDRLTEWRDEQI